MKHALAALLALLFSGQAFASSFYFDGVDVVPMGTEVVLRDQTVVVRDGRIVALGPVDRVVVPEDGRRIDGRGRYLIPGLAEMHAHVPGIGRGEQVVQDVLMLYLANGVTTIRGMLGEASHLELRRKLSAGEATGPRLITSGPSLNGRSVVSPEQAAAMVREQAAAGYDFLKLHPGLTRGEYEAIVEAAKDVGIPFAGHVSVEVGIPLTLASRQATIDHLDGYAQELVPGDHPLHGVAPEFFGVNLAAGLRTARVRDLARATRDAGVWNVLTQSLLENMLYAQSLDALMARPEMSYVQASTIEQWRERVVAIRESIGPSLAQNFLSTRRALLEQLQIEGAGLLLGSDAPQIMNVPGFSIHEELGYLVGAGLTPYQALATGTIHIATFLGEPDRGRVEPGFVADLVLLAGNPLEDVSRTREVLGVMRGGEWYERRWLDERLEAIRRRKI